MENLSIDSVHKRLSNKEISCKELVKSFLDTIKNKDKDIHAYLEIDEEGAIEQAKKIDEKIKENKDIGELGGVPIALKDNILAKGFKCTAGSKILEGYKAPYNATVTERLKNVGAIIIGKTNLDEFAMGSSTENSAFGPTKNPLDQKRVPGGSSGGSAAAVCANMCVASLGSDTGGSVRQPAAFCGVVGFKPTYGAVSRYGLIAMASSLDQIGPITNSVEDARSIFDAIRGEDKFDATSLDVESRIENLELRNLSIGLPKEYFGKGIDSKAKEVIEKSVKKYEENGAKIREISLPHTEYGLAVYYIIMPAEVSSNLARYDGVRYGLSSSAQDLLSSYIDSRNNGFGKEVRRRIMLGTHILSSGYYDAYYLQAQKVRARVMEDFDKAFNEVDVIMTPATPGLPFKFGEKTKDPVSMYLSDIFTVGASLVGLPAITLPCDWVEDEGEKLPIGLQIIGPQGQDDKILDVAEMYEKLTV